MPQKVIWTSSGQSCAPSCGCLPGSQCDCCWPNTGATGASGVQGTTGVQGATGLTGATGAGATGATGPAGVQGPQGFSGLPGGQGATGSTGPSGVNGLPGIQGATGPQGASGSGATGATGSTGLTGLVGSTGATGILGSTGATGPAGITAPLYQATYYKSANQNLINGSTDITFDQDASWNNDNGLITHTSGSADFVVAQSGLYQLEFNVSVNANAATWNTANSKVISIDITRSPNAEQVVIGQTAVTATTQNYTQSVVSTFRLETGDIINLRVQGNYSTATPFAQGVQNTIDLNTWFSWRLLNSGTQGLTGSTGATGAIGLTGATGPSGGPIGSTGATGATGVAGVNGATGATGDTGAAGVNGATGATGNTGPSGTNGATGATGLGTTGATGATGPSGSAGTNGATGAPGATGATGLGATGATGATGIGTVGATGATGVAPANVVTTDTVQTITANKTFDGNVKLKIFTGTRQNSTISSGTLTLDLSLANFFTTTLNANVTTLTLSSVPASPDLSSIVLQIFFNSNTVFTITWPASFKWAGGTGPTLTCLNGKYDTFSFLTYDGGTTWFAYTIEQNQ